MCMHIGVCAGGCLGEGGGQGQVKEAAGEVPAGGDGSGESGPSDTDMAASDLGLYLLAASFVLCSAVYPSCPAFCCFSCLVFCCSFA